MSTKFDQEYQKLNPEQQLAVDTIDGPVLVVAGPGSGKTQLLSMRVANILQQTDTPASSILCLTFTDSAAINMRQRLRTIIGPEANKVTIHTFHSFGSEVINQNSEHFFFGTEFRPADELASISILEKILKDLPISDPLASYHPDHGWSYLRDIQKRITDLKKAGLTPEEFATILEHNQVFLEQINPQTAEYFKTNTPKQTAANWPSLIEIVENIPGSLQPPNYNLKKVLLKTMRQVQEQLETDDKTSSKPVTTWKNKYCKPNDKKQTTLKDFLNLEKYQSLARTYAKYQAQLHKQGLYDFDDMLLEVVQAFEKSPELKFQYQEEFLYILVDEFQDTSGVQVRLLDNLVDMEVTNGRPNLMAVGDDDQSIYKFQGASLGNILDFKENYNNVKIITLTKNYRSKQPILDLASQIIENCQTRLSDLPEVNKVLVGVTPTTTPD